MSKNMAAKRREEFLARIRGRLAAGDQAPHPGRWPGRAAIAAGGGDPMTRRAVLEIFATELRAAGGHLRHVDGPAGLAQALREIAKAAGTFLILRDDDPRWREPAGTPWLAALEETGLDVVTPAAGRVAAAQAGIGVTWADWAIAETGTLVQLAGRGRARSTSLLPPVHVALVRPERVLARRSELIAVLREGKPAARLPSQVVLITGPSRTGDIENDLTIGVHGPGEVHVLILAPEGASGGSRQFGA